MIIFSINGKKNKKLGAITNKPKNKMCEFELTILLFFIKNNKIAVFIK